MIRFVNRNKEFQIFEACLENITGKNLIILYGNIGVGKSELARQFLLGYHKYPAIKVSISHKNEFESGYYLGKILEYSNKPINEIEFGLTEQKYLLKKNKISFPVKILYNIAKVLPILKDFLEVISSSYREYQNAKQFFTNFSSRQNIIQIEDYLTELYKNRPFILNIENIQTIDEISWNSMYNILEKSPNFSLILEYTSSTEHNMDISTIIQKYRNIIIEQNIKIIEIKQLGNTHVMDIDRTLSISQKKELEEQLSRWNGNLKEIENFLYFNKYTHKIPVIDSTKYIIESLDDDILDWLIKIYYSSDEFSIEQFKKMGLSDRIYCLLMENHLIKSNNMIVTTDHDTICNILDQNKYSSIKKNAIQFWKNYYKTEYENTYDIGSMYKLLTFTLLDNDIDAINNLLKIVHKYIISAAEPMEYLNRIEKIYYQNTFQNQNTRVEEILLFWLSELYQNIGNYKKAYTFLTYVQNTNSNKFIVMKALLLYQAGFQENAANYCNDILSNNFVDLHTELFLRIIRLEAYYTLEEYEKVKNDYSYIESNTNKFNKFFEYGFFLRNAELIKEPAQAIPDIKKSIRHFEKFRAHKQAISSRINLGVCYALLGNLNKAEYQFKIAYNSKDNFFGLHDMILNNQATILQYKGKLVGITDKLLLAKKYAFYDFNKLAICINLLVYNIRTGKEDNMLVKDILSLIENRTFKNKRIVCYAYINLYNYYKDKNAKLALDYYNKIFEFEPLPYYIYEWISEPRLLPDDPEYYRTRIRWPINFLNEWSIEFDSSLMHFE